MTEKKIITVFSASVLAALLVALILPIGESGRIVAAILLLPAAVLIAFFVKKRNTLSLHKRTIIWIMAASAVIYISIYYLLGLKFGFYKNPYRFSYGNFFKFILPIATIIISTEIIRFVMMSQKGKLFHVLCYFSCVISDMLIYSNISWITSFNRFMDLVAGIAFPAVLFNLVYNYLSKRYGIYPNTVFRAIFTLHSYILPVTPNISESLVNLFNLFLPIAIYIFIDALYENKRKYALGKRSKMMRLVSRTLALVAVFIVFGTIMLISNQFKYGALVIATESMTGEVNKGDVVIYESYDDQTVKEGQIIVFESKGSTIVHRVVEIKIINGIAQYYTKGDANEDKDSGYITESQIVGLVNYKIPSLGYPTLWMRSLFNR